MQHQNLCPDLSSCQVRDSPILQVSAKPATARSVGRPITTATLTVRPYTARKGDTLESIAQKRGEHFWVAFLGDAVCFAHTNLDCGLLPLWRIIWYIKCFNAHQAEACLLSAAFSLADVTVKEIIALNLGIDPNKVEEKQTILIPGGKLSSRDKEILAGRYLTLAWCCTLHLGAYKHRHASSRAKECAEKLGAWTGLNGRTYP